MLPSKQKRYRERKNITTTQITKLDLQRLDTIKEKLQLENRHEAFDLVLACAEEHYAMELAIGTANEK